MLPLLFVCKVFGKVNGSQEEKPPVFSPFARLPAVSSNLNFARPSLNRASKESSFAAWGFRICCICSASIRFKAARPACMSCMPVLPLVHRVVMEACAFMHCEQVEHSAQHHPCKDRSSIIHIPSSSQRPTRSAHKLSVAVLQLRR